MARGALSGTLDPRTHGAVLTETAAHAPGFSRGEEAKREYAEFQDLLVAMGPPGEREALGTLLRHLVRQALAEASPGDHP